MRRGLLLLFLTCAISGSVSAQVAPARNYPAPVEGDHVIANFRFRSGEVLPELKLHYRTIGTAQRDGSGVVRNAVLILHGTGGAGTQFLSPQFAGVLFGPGQLLDATRYFIILPDGIGHGGSSKPSDGLHARFPHYTYDDMVAAHHQLLTEKLGVNHLRLVMGTSMGGMQTWVWGETYPDFMEEWVRDGVAPPPSSYPRLNDGTLVARDKLSFPKIPDVNLPQTAHQAYRLDFGPEWSKGMISKQPPTVGTPYPVFVPQVNADGNEVAGVRLPELSLPVATYTGWNLRDPKTGAPWARVSFLGSYLPFAKIKSDREKRGDPRASLEERYQSKAQYLGLYAEAAMDLIQRRFLLREDLAGVLRRGTMEWDEAQK